MFLFKVTFRFNGESRCTYYKVSSVNAMFRYLITDFTSFSLKIWEIKRVLRLPKGVEPISI